MRPPLIRRPSRPSRAARIALGTVALVATAVLLTGCQAATDSKPAGTPTAHSSASATTKSSAVASATPTAKSTPIAMSCDELITAEQRAQLLPPISPEPGFTPTKGSQAADAVKYDGVACGLRNPSTNNVTVVAVARPSADQLTALKNDAITHSKVVPTYGVPPTVMGYFDVSGSTGVAQAFRGGYWIVAASKDYIEPGDAGQVIAAVLANLRS